MKTIVPSFISRLTLVFFLTISLVAANGQNQELIFTNSTLSTAANTAGKDGAIYRFPTVKTGVDAMVKILGRSDNNVKLMDIDLTSSGFSNAFQPEVQYSNGSVNASATWYMEFEITFVIAGTSTPIAVNNFKVTALDIDGDNNKLHEWDAFYAPNAITLENNTLLTQSNLMQTINGVNTIVGKQFDGPTTQYVAGIDTTTTTIMATLTYSSASVFKFRAGATTTGSSNQTMRMYSTWFKTFAFSSPITLPVKLAAFSAMLNNNNRVDLKWTTSYEKNVSHFVIEKSLDGRNYSDAGMVFAYGNTTSDMNYMYADNLGNSTATVIYYRLRSVDIDGKSEYSDVRVIRISKAAENNITILTYPNPVANELRVTIPANWQNKKVSYELFNANGQSARRSTSSNASQTETLNVTNLAPGFYIVRVTCEGSTVQQKVVKN
jgi:hypothetical protein